MIKKIILDIVLILKILHLKLMINVNCNGYNLGLVYDPVSVSYSLT